MLSVQPQRHTHTHTHTESWTLNREMILASMARPKLITHKTLRAEKFLQPEAEEKVGAGWRVRGAAGGATWKA